jgi:hypothetical protein
MRPSSAAPASVTPTWKGYEGADPARAASRAARRRYAWIATWALLAFMLKTTSRKPSCSHTSRNSRALSTIPSGVSP